MYLAVLCRVQLIVSNDYIDLKPALVCIVYSRNSLCKWDYCKEDKIKGLVRDTLPASLGLRLLRSYFTSSLQH